MLSTIKLNNELLFKANEIYDVVVYGLLSSEFRSFELPASEFSPEQPLRVCRVLSKGFSQCCESFGHLEFSSPLTLTLSPQGRGNIPQTTVCVHLARYLISHLADNITISKADMGQKELVTLLTLLYGESHRI